MNAERPEHMQPPQKQQQKQQRICGVCSDKAKSMHFGGLSCDSCKAFFRRAVFRDSFLKFTCPNNRKCEINTVSRKCCQHCRYQKCTSIGMDKSYVMADDKSLPPKQKKAHSNSKYNKKTQKNVKHLEPFEPDISAMLDFMSHQERDEIEQIIIKYRCAYREIPYRKDLREYSTNMPSLQIVNMFTTVVRRFAYFAQLFPDFCELPPQDQSILLRNGILDMCLIRGVQAYDTENNRWPNTNQVIYKDAATLRIEDMKKLVSSKLYETNIKFLTSMKELNLDEPVLMILLMILLFTTDQPGLIENKKVQITQEKYLMHLRKYMTWRYGSKNTSLLYPKLLMKLTDLRELNDQHNEYNLRLADQEVQEIQNSLGKLNLNPYPNWPHIMKQIGGDGTLSNSGTNASMIEGTTNNKQLNNWLDFTTKSDLKNTKVSCLDMASRIKEPSSSNSEYISLEKENTDTIEKVQTIFMKQLKKSVKDILNSPSFGVNDLLQSNRSTQQVALQEHTQPYLHENQLKDRDPLRTTKQNAMIFSKQQKKLQNTKLSKSININKSISLKEQKIQISNHTHAKKQLNSALPEVTKQHKESTPCRDSVCTLVSEIDYIETRQLNAQNLQIQSQKAFQQIENDLIGNITEYDNYPQQFHIQHQSEYHHCLQNPLYQYTQPLTLNPSTNCIISPSQARKSQNDTQELVLNTKQNHLMEKGGLDLFRSLLEDFTHLENPNQLDAVKQLLGPELLSSIQQKLLESEIHDNILQIVNKSSPLSQSDQCLIPENVNNYQITDPQQDALLNSVQQLNTHMNNLSPSHKYHSLPENEVQSSSHHNEITMSQLNQVHKPIEQATPHAIDIQLDLQSYPQLQPFHQFMSVNTSTINELSASSNFEYELQGHLHQHSQIHHQHSQPQIPFTSYNYQQHEQQFQVQHEITQVNSELENHPAQHVNIPVQECKNPIFDIFATPNCINNPVSVPNQTTFSQSLITPLSNPITTNANENTVQDITATLANSIDHLPNSNHFSGSS